MQKFSAHKLSVKLKTSGTWEWGIYGLKRVGHLMRDRAVSYYFWGVYSKTLVFREVSRSSQDYNFWSLNSQPVAATTVKGPLKACFEEFQLLVFYS